MVPPVNQGGIWSSGHFKPVAKEIGFPKLVLVSAAAKVRSQCSADPVHAIGVSEPGSPFRRPKCHIGILNLHILLLTYSFVLVSEHFNLCFDKEEF